MQLDLKHRRTREVGWSAQGQEPSTPFYRAEGAGYYHLRETCKLEIGIKTQYDVFIILGGLSSRKKLKWEMLEIRFPDLGKKRTV